MTYRKNHHLVSLANDIDRLIMEAKTIPERDCLMEVHDALNFISQRLEQAWNVSQVHPDFKHLLQRTSEGEFRLITVSGVYQPNNYNQEVHVTLHDSAQDALQLAIKSSEAFFEACCQVLTDKP